MRNQKSFTPILVVFLIVVGIGGYFVYTNYSNNRIAPIQQTLQPVLTSSTTKTEHVLITKVHSFDIQIPSTYSIKKNAGDDSLVKDVAHIYDDQGKEVLFIYTYAAGERTPIGNLIIDSVPFTINYFKDIQCLADLDATNWIPGTKPLFGIQVKCDKANQEQLDQYKTIIQSIKFSPELKEILMGKIRGI